jgi:hypothetical protein
MKVGKKVEMKVLHWVELLEDLRAEKMVEKMERN